MPYRIHLLYVLIQPVHHAILPFLHAEREWGTTANLLLPRNVFSGIPEQLMFMNGKLMDNFTKKDNGQK